MRILWLEDEPITIEVVQDKMSKYCIDIEVYESFSGFSDELEELDDSEENIVILDIRMLVNSELKYRCFGKSFLIEKELEAGFEYYINCMKKRFNFLQIIFFSSKPSQSAKEDAVIYKLNPDQIISKEDFLQLIEIIKGASYAKVKI